MQGALGVFHVGVQGRIFTQAAATKLVGLNWAGRLGFPFRNTTYLYLHAVGAKYVQGFHTNAGVFGFSGGFAGRHQAPCMSDGNRATYIVSTEQVHWAGRASFS